MNLVEEAKVGRKREGRGRVEKTEVSGARKMQ